MFCAWHLAIVACGEQGITMSLRIIAAYSLPVQHQAHVHSTANSYMLIT